MSFLCFMIFFCFISLSVNKSKLKLHRNYSKYYYRKELKNEKDQSRKGRRTRNA